MTDQPQIEQQNKLIGESDSQHRAARSKLEAECKQLRDDHAHCASELADRSSRIDRLKKVRARDSAVFCSWLKALDEALKMNSDATADQLRLASEVSALQSRLQVAEQQARATEQLVRSECNESDSRFAVVAHCSSPHVPESDPKISNSRPRCYSAAM